MTYVFSAYSLILVFTTAISLMVAYWTWTRRTAPGAIYLFFINDIHQLLDASVCFRAFGDGGVGEGVFQSDTVHRYFHIGNILSDVCFSIHA